MGHPHRLVVPDLPHHITQRGNSKQNIFLDDEDRRCYLTMLRQECKTTKLKILGYCLMTNHVHLVVIPPEERSLADGIGRAHWSYSRVFNRRHGRSGALWQARFFSCPMDEAHLYQALRYVELNPSRAGLVKNPWDYAWSSAQEHMGQKQPGHILDLSPVEEDWGHKTWPEYLLGPGSDEDRDILRVSTTRGSPWEAVPTA